MSGFLLFTITFNRSSNMTQSTSATNDFELLNDEQVQQQHANQIAVQVFHGEENAEKTGNLITTFVDSYSRQRHELPLNEWLTSEFRLYPMIWQDDAEIITTTNEIIVSVTAANEAKTALYTHLDKNKSRDSWLAQRLEMGAKQAGVINVGEYAAGIDRALTDANDQFRERVLNQDGTISINPHLHGLLAESEIANQFNIRATTSGSTVRAEVLNETGWNSHDIVLKDAAGKPIENIQVKSYADTEQLIKNLKDHKGYPEGTTIVVHEEQVQRVQEEFPDRKVTSKIEVDDVAVDMPSREELKQLQEDAQRDAEIREYEWSEVNRVNVAKAIGKQALAGAAITAGMQGARILGRRIWNSITGKENPSVNEDLQEFFESSVKSGANVGVQVAVSGAVVVAAKNGWLGALLKNTPAGRIANIVYVGMENAKVLFKFATGELSGEEALDAAGNVSCSAIGGLMGAGYGMAQGAALGAIFGPIGIAVGGFVGGVVGGMAGSTIGEAVYAGGKAIVKTAVSVMKSIAEGVKNVVTSVASALNPLNWF
ncbi:hypothetical protein CXB77_02825 [Chromatium okenii]|uniref:Glycine zipper family protein n=2 Tax=Chromatium okenii TaxID=61644 RepID=A0A2S7XU80_9GAMM|nr:hypothetical protein CXB77_02825 [Chromatium okenii]